ncbi:MAG: hypothetical protein BECKG1743D_GA0114223_101112 [Candidatus Kentron sp. G]|nr:MAG: hypothetical protein BECKG1743F_GA0114225_101336 [Candidatus Kentron sp. G]VFM97224.1 MAG: hypothetical protein BECKG1743E_GA0114224_101201 [Candidatus Kentron sp. G]VFM99256.1 MAG: hypothetical protein BECKG1743D_GA0114223_101112 [Candidatus Kentron sp. G]
MKTVRAITWTTPADIENQVRRLWERGKILAARFQPEPMFPLRLSFRAPASRELAEEFGAVRDWIGSLEQKSRSGRGFGYDILWREVNHRQLGRNAVPKAIEIATEADAVRLIGKTGDAQTFSRLAEKTLASFPILRDWLARKPLTALDHADEWGRILGILSWFHANPRSGLYLRQLDIAGVDTKFIEGRRGLLAELLTLVLPPEAIDPAASGAREFEQRFGLRPKPFLVRLRLLDPSLSLAGLTDISVPGAQLARVPLPVHRVFITENEINGLAFPGVPGAMVIFGLGYGLDRLREITWLREKEVHYWGDIDTHGFAILNRLRATFPHAKSFLMDEDTLLDHRALWGWEDKRFIGDLDRLTDPERSVFRDLCENRFGEGIRLEQERISFARVARSVKAIGDTPV